MSDTKIPSGGFLLIPNAVSMPAGGKSPEMKELRAELKKATSDGRLMLDEERAVAAKLGTVFASLSGQPDQFEAVAAGVKKIVDAAPVKAGYLDGFVAAERISNCPEFSNPSVQKLVQLMDAFLASGTIPAYNDMCASLADAFKSLNTAEDVAKLKEFVTDFSRWVSSNYRDDFLLWAQAGAGARTLNSMVDDIFGVDPSES